MNFSNSCHTIGAVVPSTGIEITSKTLKRFWAKVNKTEGCWVWTASTAPGGYGAFGVKSKVLRAHRVSFQIHNGPFDPLLDVCHHCDNPACVRPDHLFLGSHTDNMQDMHKKGRYNESKRGPNRKRGTYFWSAKLTPELVSKIRQEYVPYLVGKRYLARKYGVTKNAVNVLLKRITWKHVP